MTNSTMESAARMQRLQQLVLRRGHRRLRATAAVSRQNSCVRCRYMKILNSRADLITSIESLTEQNGELKMLLNE